MKTLILIISLLLLVLRSESQVPNDRINAGIVLKITFLPFIGETVVGGKISFSEDSLFFDARPCSEADKKWTGVFPCADVIKPIKLSLRDIKKIKRRSYLFLFPNRLFIRTTSNHSYLFTTYKRRMIIRKYQSYMATLNGMNGENKVGKVH